MWREINYTSATNHGFYMAPKKPEMHMTKLLLENIYTDILLEGPEVTWDASVLYVKRVVFPGGVTL